jgi:hypothetical protein
MFMQGVLHLEQAVQMCNDARNEYSVAAAECFGDKREMFILFCDFVFEHEEKLRKCLNGGTNRYFVGT